MRVTSVAVSEVGKVRDHNEDAVFADDDLGLWLVADGMGGHAAGEVASRLAVDTVVEEVKVGSALKDAVNRAHAVIKAAAKQHPDRAGMGTTIVAIKRQKSSFTVVWSGDSRAYTWGRNGKLSQLTSDHSFVGDMVARGILSEQEAEAHPKKNLINQALGMPSILHLAPGELTFRARHRGGILLCSDGVSDMLGSAQLEEICQAGANPYDRSTRLALAIESTPAIDNYSFVLLDYEVGGMSRLLSLWKRG